MPRTGSTDHAPVQLDERELEWKFVRAPGPGGQHVNKTSSAVQLRFDLRANQSLAPEVKQRLRALAGHRLNADGSVLIISRTARSQEQNRRVAREKLLTLIEAALEPPRVRKPTKVSRAVKARRARDKQLQAQRKKSRASAAWD